MSALRLIAALAGCAAAATLAGCGGAQPLVGAPGTSPQSPAFASAAARAKSWMLPEAKREALLYADASAGSAHAVYVFSYPKGKLVGTISEPSAQYQLGLCSNARGDVFVTSLSNDYFGGVVYEYAHGAAKPRETLYESGVWPWGCAVDPTTGNLAVASINLDSLASWVEVYQKAKGMPQDYYNEQIINYMFCSYDDKGNLFVDGTGSGSNAEFGELPKGGSTLMNVNLSRNVHCCGQVQWDGRYVAIDDQQAGAIYRLKVSGSTATIVGTTRLQQWTDGSAQSWIQNNVVISANGSGATEIASWRYPHGGNPTTNIPVPAAVFGVTVSLAHRGRYASLGR